ncbi:hypothetical protein Esti_005800 [Eimeria stiedai]
MAPLCVVCYSLQPSVESKPPPRQGEKVASMVPSCPPESEASQDKGQDKESVTFSSRKFYNFPRIEDPQHMSFEISFTRVRKQLKCVMIAVYNNGKPHAENAKMRFDFPLLGTAKSLLVEEVTMKEVGMKFQEAFLEVVANVEQRKPCAHEDTNSSRCPYIFPAAPLFGNITLLHPPTVLSCGASSAEPTRVSLSRAVVSRSNGQAVGYLVFSFDTSWARSLEQPAEKSIDVLFSPLEGSKKSAAPADDSDDQPTSSVEISPPLPEEPTVSPDPCDEPAAKPVDEPLSTTKPLWPKERPLNCQQKALSLLRSPPQTPRLLHHREIPQHL